VQTLNINSSSITGCCKGRYIKSHNFIWRYEKEPFNKHRLERKFTWTPIIELSKNGEVVNEWKCINDLLNTKIISRTHLHRILTSNNRLYKNYYYKYKNGY